MYYPTESIPRESKELIATTVKRGDIEITDYDLTLTPLADRPTDWTAPVSIGEDKGYLLPGTFEPGLHILWARADTGTEVVVILVRMINLT